MCVSFRSWEKRKSHKIKIYGLLQHFSHIGLVLFVCVLHMTIICRRDSFITHRAFCDALAEETARSVTGIVANSTTQPTKVAGIVISSSSWEVS